MNAMREYDYAMLENNRRTKFQETVNNQDISRLINWPIKNINSLLIEQVANTNINNTHTNHKHKQR